jgi:hypothetical protein
MYTFAIIFEYITISFLKSKSKFYETEHLGCELLIFPFVERSDSARALANASSSL